MNKQCVSVIIASYNHEPYIEESINSVINQTYKHVQLVVIDDCSSDNSANCIQKIKIDNDFIFIQNSKNLGLNTSILKALELCTGDYISILASDDYILPSKIEEQVSFLEQARLDGVYANGYKLFNEERQLIKLHKLFDNYSQSEALNFIYTNDSRAPLLQSALLKRSLIHDLIYIRQEFKSDDWAFLIKALELYNIGFMKSPVFVYRIHTTNTHKNYWKTFPMRMEVVARLVPEKYKLKSIGNIFLSQGQYLISDKKYRASLKLFISSIVLNFSFANILLISRTLASSVFHSVKLKK